ncbi:MAG TPA: asparaginase domain-containing protein [Stellaceae bacterium]|nr:asparaginase domain-containing protein [Stellaceae bacterium]
MPTRIKIAHLAGPNATIQNTPPLVTSNKARARYGLPLATAADGEALRYDMLRPQRLAVPATVYVEQFSAHPLEADAADLYGPPDGYITEIGEFATERRGSGDRPVYKIELDPADGLYPMPYMARQADGKAWEGDGTALRVPRAQSRQPFMPDGRRTFEEIDRLGISSSGLGNLVSSKADVDFFRLAPSGGYLKGKPEADIAAEKPGKDFFPYRPPHLGMSPPRMTLARITNMAQKILGEGKYDGAIWTQGSPRIEETMYWFNLALDVTVPICGNASQRYHGEISNDGPKNIADSVEFLHSKVWADRDGRNRAGMVLIQDQRVFAAREVTKADARPGGYVVTGGAGGVLGMSGGTGGAVLRYIPATLHTYASEVRLTQLPMSVQGIRRGASGIELVDIVIKNAAGELLETAIPKVSIVKDASYIEDDYEGDPAQEVDVRAFVDYKLEKAPLAGFVLEGLNPYGKAASSSKTRALTRTVYTGFPVVNVGRGNTEGFALPGGGPFIGGSNLTATKARILLMLCIMKLGMLPPAQDSEYPTRDEIQATERKLKQYQAIFNSH